MRARSSAGFGQAALECAQKRARARAAIFREVTHRGLLEQLRLDVTQRALHHAAARRHQRRPRALVTQEIHLFDDLHLEESRRVVVLAMARRSFEQVAVADLVHPMGARQDSPGRQVTFTRALIDLPFVRGFDLTNAAIGSETTLTSSDNCGVGVASDRFDIVAWR